MLHGQLDRVSVQLIYATQEGRLHTDLVFCLLLTSVLCISRSHPMAAAHLSWKMTSSLQATGRWHELRKKQAQGP